MRAPWRTRDLPFLAVGVLTAMALMSPQATASTPRVTVTPGVCASTCVLRVSATQRINAYLQYGYSSSALTKRTPLVTVPASGPKVLTLTGLRAGSTLHYRLRYTLTAGGTFRMTAIASVAVAARISPADGLVVAIQADPHMDENSDAAVYSGTLAQINASAPAFLIDLGDTVMIDKLPQKTDAAIRARYELMKGFYDKLDPSIALYLAMGNHDGEAGWETLQGHRYRTEYFPKQTYDLNYYAITQGDAHFIVLDPYMYTMTKPGSDGWKWTLGRAQYDWLANTLASSTAKHRYVCLHQLVGGDNQGRGGVELAGLYEWGGHNADGSDGFAQQRPGWSMPIHDLLRKYGVEAVFKGHDHLYAKQVLDGIVYQTVPQPSHPGDKLGSVSDYGYRTGDLVGGSGFLRLTISADSTLVQFVGPTGAVRASYTMTA